MELKMVNDWKRTMTLGVEIEEGTRQQVTESSPLPVYTFSSMRAILAPSPLSWSLVYSKMPFCIKGAQDKGGSLETAESAVPPGPSREVLWEPVRPQHGGLRGWPNDPISTPLSILDCDLPNAPQGETKMY
jgi:hypothetical protein